MIEPTALRMVRVEWVDSGFVVTGWTDVDEAKQHAADVFGQRAVTVGLLLDETPEYLLVCQSHQATGVGHDEVAECIAIPRVAVTDLFGLVAT